MLIVVSGCRQLCWSAVFITVQSTSTGRWSI